MSHAQALYTETMLTLVSKLLAQRSAAPLQAPCHAYSPAVARQQLLNDEEELRAHEETCLKLAFCRVVEGISELLQPVALGKLFPQGVPCICRCQGIPSCQAWRVCRSEHKMLSLPMTRLLQHSMCGHDY